VICKDIWGKLKIIESRLIIAIQTRGQIENTRIAIQTGGKLKII
jgi:hypothetical protein